MPRATHLPSDAKPAAPASPRTLAEALPYFARQTSPRILAVALVIAAGVRLGLGAWSAWDLLPVAVLLAYWPLNEWLIHVFILHFKPFQLWGHTVDFRVPRSHRAHHRDPWNLEILFIPVHSFSYSLVLLVGAAFLLTPTPALAFTAVTFYLAMSLHYEWVHFLAHTRYTPRTAYYHRVVRNHRLHHFKNEHYWFDVSVVGGDWLLRTEPDRDAVETSPTCRTLGMETAVPPLG
jgi:Fatty acid hydroxylase